jgi:putative ABC transport system substrate-binding protein
MRRREFIGLVGGVAVWPLAAGAQQSDRMRRLGWLDWAPADDSAAQARAKAVQQDLANLGWVVGRNLQIDYRWGAINDEAAQRFGAELLGLNPDVILSGATPATKALQLATQTVPLVFVLIAEPVGQGFVQSLAHPGGNITGFSTLERSIGAKWLQLLVEAAPNVKRVAFVFSPKVSPYAQYYYDSIKGEAERVSVGTELVAANESAEIEPILARLGPDAGVIFNSDSFVLRNLKLAIDLSAKYRVPAMYGTAGMGNTGGLIAYSLDLLDHYRQAAPYIDRILRGEKPANLPVQQPTKFQLVINLKTARTLGISVPLTLQTAADEVIE